MIGRSRMSADPTSRGEHVTSAVEPDVSGPGSDAAQIAAGARFYDLIDAAKRCAAIPTAVVHPVDAPSLRGAVEAQAAGLIRAVLVGPERKIRAAAAETEINLTGCELVPAQHSHAAAEQAVALARCGRVQSIMKGALHSDEILRAAVSHSSGLRTERRMSHVFVLDMPDYPKHLFVTDAVVNVTPDLAAKRDIVQNAIELAIALGVGHPAVAVIAPVETVTSKIPSTLDAAALAKMAQRGQITGGLVDGPLAFDLAVSADAVTAKGLVSEVAGHADIFVVADLNSGNMLAKSLEHLAGALSAGIVLGARVPIALTSRSDGPLARLASCALAVLVAAAQPGHVA